MNLSDMEKEIGDSYARDNVDNTMRSVYTRGFRSGVRWYAALKAESTEKADNKQNATCMHCETVGINNCPYHGSDSRFST